MDSGSSESSVCDRTLLRMRAAVADEASQQKLDLALLWHDLIGGKRKIHDAFSTGERWYLLLTAADAAGVACTPLAPRKRDVLVRTLLSRGQKVVAMELERAPSTIAFVLRQCLEFMGLSCAPLHLPPLLAVAAMAALGHSEVCEARLGALPDPDGPLIVVSVARLDARLATLLPPAEFAVARLLVDGKTHREIAAQRHTSARTIANQLRSSFQRLGVSGRADLLRYIVSWEAATTARLHQVSA